MFDIGWSELMIIGVVALIVVGPKDLPRMFRTLGEYTGKARKMAREFQSAMNQAADESGVGSITADLRKIANPKKFGTDVFNDATAELRAWHPDEADGSPKLTAERAAAKAQASTAADAAELSGEPDLLPDPAAAAPKAAMTAKPEASDRTGAAQVKPAPAKNSASKAKPATVAKPKGPATATGKPTPKTIAAPKPRVSSSSVRKPGAVAAPKS